MITERSFGIVPLRIDPDQTSTSSRSKTSTQVLLIKQKTWKSKSTQWSLPKGHAEEGETPIESATRELFEETGLRINTLLFEDPIHERYTNPENGKQKEVVYFVAWTSGILELQEAEVADARWVGEAEALELMTFEEGRRVVREAFSRLKAAKLV